MLGWGCDWGRKVGWERIEVRLGFLGKNEEKTMKLVLLKLTLCSSY